MKISIYFYLSFLFFLNTSILIAQINECNNFFIDLTADNDSVFTSPAVKLNGNCCTDNDTINCVQFQVNFSEEARGFRFSRLGFEGNYLMNCELEHSLVDVICLDDNFGIYYLTFCDSDTSLMQFEIESIPNLDYEVIITPPNDSVFGIATIMVDTTQISSITFDNGETGISAYQLLAGTHQAEIIDVNGCTELVTFNMPCYKETFEISGVSFCEPDNDSLDVNFVFSEYKIIDSRGNMVIGSLPIDSISSLFLVSEDKCWIPIELSFFPKPEVTIEAVDFCSGIPTLLGVSQNFTSYFWSNGDTSNETNINRKGIYSVTVTDVNGCIGKDIFEVKEEALEVIILGETSCSETVTNLTALPSNLNYLWSSGEETQQITVEEAREYTVTVTNQNGCFGSESIYIEPFDSLDFELISSIDCETGLTKVFPSKSFPFYSWSTGATTDTIIVDSPGTYQLSVKNENGCESNDFIQVENNSIIETLLNFDCKEDFEKLLELGDEFDDFTNFSWSNGNSSDTTLITFPGIYYITATADNGCKLIDSIEIIGLDSLGITIQINEEDSNGFVQVNISSGNGPFLYTWSTGEENSSGFLSNLEPGEYSVTVTDITGCTKVESFSVGTNTGLKEISKRHEDIVYPNPFDNILYVQEVTEFPNKKIKLFDVNGLQVSISRMELSNKYYKLEINDLEKGLYFLVLGDSVYKVVRN